MKNVPTMISTKDSAYIKDMFNWNLVALKKFSDYLEYVTDEEIADLLEELVKMHSKNCKELIKILESDGKNDW